MSKSDERPVDYRPRLSIEITKEQKEALDKVLGHTFGLQKTIFTIIIDDLIRILTHEHGQAFLGAIISRHAKLEDWTDTPLTSDDFS